MTRVLGCVVGLCGAVAAGAAETSDWPMLGHDPGRSGATAAEVRPPFERKWYRAFPDEGLMAGVQPVVASGRVFVGTLRGVVHAIDAETGGDLWTLRAGGPVLHACAADDRHVFFTCADGKVYCADAAGGNVLWTFQTGAALWNAPALENGRVFVGGRDGRVYALGAEDGATRWSSAVGGPVLCSPAVDPERGRVYVGAEDMRVYAFDRDTGKQAWASERLPGVSFRGYHPVVAPDGSVMITSQPCAGGDAVQQVMLDVVKEVFGDFASWRHSKEENETLRERNFRQMQDPATYRGQIDYLRRRLADEPAYQTFFVLDPGTGKQKFVAPVVYAESMNGTGSPAVVTPRGKVIVKYSALLRSRYEHYSPFLNVGSLDTATGDVEPVMDQGRTYGWHDSLLLVHDEQSQLSVAGGLLFNAHQDNVNALDLGTLKGFERPMCHNVHEPPPGAAASIWAMQLAGKSLPAGWEWFARGTAVYGGGSALDVPIAVAGDSFYYLPTHEISAGCVLLAYRTKRPGGADAADKAPPPAGKLSPRQWEQIQSSGKWDWDTLASPRLDVTLKALPEFPPGTRQRPMTSEAEAKVAAIADEELDRQVVFREPTFRGAADDAPLRFKLAGAVDELVSTRWRPLLFPAGKAPAEAYRFFTDPVETLYTLALAYPHLEPGLGAKVRRFVNHLDLRHACDPHAGTVRSAYGPAPEKLLRVVEDVAAWSETARLYPMWLWATVADDWETLRREWPNLRERVATDAGPKEFDCGNGQIAGLIAACRVAKKLDDRAALERLLPATRAALRRRLVYELSHTRGGLITATPDGRRSVFGRWRHLTPDVARLCRLYARDVHAGLMDVYVDHHRPAWWLAWNVETLWGNEVPDAFPTHAQEVFAARAMILAERGESLAKYVDLPWCAGDESFVQKLALALHAAAGTAW